MRYLCMLVMLPLGVLWAADETPVIVNPAEAKWSHDPGDPPGSEGVMLRQDSQTKGLELFVRFPAGHVIAPHWHDVNERIVVIEGRLGLKEGAETRYIDAGGYAFLPAKQVQRLSCVSQSRCALYINWDGPPTSHKAE